MTIGKSTRYSKKEEKPKIKNKKGLVPKKDKWKWRKSSRTLFEIKEVAKEEAH